MRTHLDLHYRFWHERIDQEMAAAAERRRVIQPAGSIRRSLGHRIIAIGTRLAAEQPFELARPR
ncbi:MAG: hypothetical protein QOJ75_233 [Chloroflexota bacterium]|jgi:hypothetical protein|nr:hypothetical protein [Chloroflexota bacterium]